MPVPAKAAVTAVILAGTPAAPLLPAGDARSRQSRHLFFSALLVVLMGATGAVPLKSLFFPPPPVALTPFPRVATLTEQQARQRAETLVARITGPHVVAVDAWAVVNSPGFGRTPLAEWQVDCRTGTGPYFVRLEAATGQVLAIAPQTLHATGVEGTDEEESGERLAEGHATLSASRAAALARRYLKLAELAPPPGPSSSPGTRSELRWFAGPLNPSCSVTFHFHRRRGLAAPSEADEANDNDGTTQLVRVDMDARDGSLHGLYRMRRFGQPVSQKAARGGPSVR